MRRKDREITNPAEMLAILEEAQICRLALADGGEPYVVPVCFGIEGRTIWIHSAPEGKKIDMLRKNPRCCIEVDSTGGPLPADRPCAWEMQYRSVVCTGTASFVEGADEKYRGLNCILAHYGGAEHAFTEKEMEHVCVLRIDIREMTGKKHG